MDAQRRPSSATLARRRPPPEARQFNSSCRTPPSTKQSAAAVDAAPPVAADADEDVADVDDGTVDRIHLRLNSLQRLLRTVNPRWTAPPTAQTACEHTRSATAPQCSPVVTSAAGSGHFARCCAHHYPAPTPQQYGYRPTDAPEGVWRIAGSPGGLHAHIAGLIGRTHVHMLCDTGAACSCVSRAFYESHLASMTPLIRPRRLQNLVATGGSDLTTVGKVTVNFKVGGYVLSTEFFVVDDLTHNVILGAEFFERTGAHLDYKHKRLRLYNGTINVPLLTAIDPFRVVHLL